MGQHHFEWQGHHLRHGMDQSECLDYHEKQCLHSETILPHHEHQVPFGGRTYGHTQVQLGHWKWIHDYGDQSKRRKVVHQVIWLLLQTVQLETLHHYQRNCRNYQNLYS